MLYGLNWAKAAIVAADEVIVCEGYTDVIGFDRVGLARAVATCGTALTEDHLRSLLSASRRRVVLAFDADAAGQAAAERFYEWERRSTRRRGRRAAQRAQIRPTSRAPIRTRCAKRSRTQCRSSASASPVCSRPVDCHDPEGRARAAEAALEVIREHPSELVRDQYVMQVADALPARPRSAPRRARARVVHGLASTIPTEQATRPHARDSRGSRAEAARCIDGTRPLPYLSEVLFTDGVTLDAFRALGADHACP